VIVGLRLENWRCYRGEQEIRLAPKAYGVHARVGGDEDRSNWAGKSALFEAVDFSLFGRLNPDRGDLVDGWISRGESKGMVALLLEADGEQFLVERGRKGRKGYVKAARRGAEKVAEGDEAEREIAAWLGLSKEDFLACAYFRQRQTARLVLMESGDRMKVASSWFGLEPLKVAETHARDEYRGRAEEEAKLIATAMELEQKAAQALGVEVGKDLAQMAAEARVALEGVDKDIAAREVSKQAAFKRAEAVNGNKGVRLAVESINKLRIEGKALRAKVDAADKVALEKERDLHRANAAQLLQEVSPLVRDVEQKNLLIRGGWGGQCPVALFPCPAAQEVLARKESASKFVEENHPKVAALRARHAEEEAKARSAEARLQEVIRDEGRLQEMRSRVKELIPLEERAEALAKEGLLEDGPAFEELEAAGKALQTAREAREVIAYRLAVAEDALKKAAEAREKAKAMRAEARASHEAAQVVLLTRRTVGEAAFGEVERGANARLARCGVDLRVRVAWEREGRDPARYCLECGSPFPSSRAVKTCTLCGADRGKNLIDELELHLSDHSGAAEDMGGLAVQLAAAEYVARKRASRWQAVLVDEPFAQCDVAHQRAVARHLAEVLANGHFRQALVTAHQAQVLNALPGRIEVARQGEWSTMRVAS